MHWTRTNSGGTTIDSTTNNAAKMPILKQHLLSVWKVCPVEAVAVAAAVAVVVVVTVAAAVVAAVAVVVAVTVAAAVAAVTVVVVGQIRLWRLQFLQA